MPLILGLICLSFVEVVVTVLLTEHFGALPTFLTFAVPTFVGLFIQWRRFPYVQAACAKMAEEARTLPKDRYKRQMQLTRVSNVTSAVEFYAFIVSVLLLFIPGPLTAIVGFSLMFPPIQACIKYRVLKQNKIYRRRLQEWKRQQWLAEELGEIASTPMPLK